MLNNENCVKNFPLSIGAISLTPKILKSGLCASLKSILTSVCPSPGIKFELNSEIYFEITFNASPVTSSAIDVDAANTIPRVTKSFFIFYVCLYQSYIVFFIITIL